MRKLWSDKAWNDYCEWQKRDRKKAAKINELIKSIDREGVSHGIGKPEPLKHRKGYSRRINAEDRLTYDVEDGIMYIYSCRGHYED